MNNLHLERKRQRRFYTTITGKNGNFGKEITKSQNK